MLPAQMVILIFLKTDVNVFDTSMNMIRILHVKTSVMMNVKMGFVWLREGVPAKRVIRCPRPINANQFVQMDVNMAFA